MHCFFRYITAKQCIAQSFTVKSCKKKKKKGFREVLYIYKYWKKYCTFTAILFYSAHVGIGQKKNPFTIQLDQYLQFIWYFYKTSL